MRISLTLQEKPPEPTVIRPISEMQVNGDLVSALARGDVEPKKVEP